MQRPQSGGRPRGSPGPRAATAPCARWPSTCCAAGRPRRRRPPMRDRIASVIAIVLLALVAATSYWYSRSLQSGATAIVLHPKVDADADAVTLIQFDSLGRAK